LEIVSNMKGKGFVGKRTKCNISCFGNRKEVSPLEKLIFALAKRRFNDGRQKMPKGEKNLEIFGKRLTFYQAK